MTTPIPAAAKPHAPTLPDTGVVLVGTGDRTVKIGFLVVNVYSLGLYVDSTGCRSSLMEEYGDLSHESLLRRGDEFYPSFTSGTFRKTFQLVFCRSIATEKLLGGFKEPLESRCEEGRLADAKAFLEPLLPSAGVCEDDVLMVTCEADGKTIWASFCRAGTGVVEVRPKVESGGVRGVWIAFQNLFFDENTAVPTVRVSAVSGLPDILVRNGEGTGPSNFTESRKTSSSIPQHQPSVKEIEEAVERELAAKAKRKETWSEFAGRDPKCGGEGYVFGDLTRGVITKLGMRKSSSGASESSDGKVQASRSRGLPGANNDTDGTKAAERKRLEDLERRERSVSALEEDVAQRERRVDNVARGIPTVHATVVIPVATEVVCDVTFRQMFGLSGYNMLAVKILLYAAGGTWIGLKLQRLAGEIKSKAKIM